jgi:hypothetical protein
MAARKQNERERGRERKREERAWEKMCPSRAGPQ